MNDKLSSLIPLVDTLLLRTQPVLFEFLDQSATGVENKALACSFKLIYEFEHHRVAIHAAYKNQRL